MKTYKVWARCGHSSTCGGGDETILEFEDSTSEKDCEAACADALDTLIGNNFDTGWDPVTPAELMAAAKKKKPAKKAAK